MAFFLYEIITLVFLVVTRHAKKSLNAVNTIKHLFYIRYLGSFVNGKELVGEKDRVSLIKADIFIICYYFGTETNFVCYMILYCICSYLKLDYPEFLPSTELQDILRKRLRQFRFF